MTKIKKKKIISFLILFFITIIYCIINSFLNIGIPCLFHKITGLYCPGCGITRMISSIINFDFYQAFRYNPLIFILFILFIIYLIIKLFVKILFNKNLKIPPIVLNIIIILLIIFGIMRNIDLFNYLSPTEL